MLTETKTEDLRAIARGYKALYEDAVAGLLRIRDECTSRDECHAAAGETLEELGMGNDDA